MRVVAPLFALTLYRTRSILHVQSSRALPRRDNKTIQHAQIEMMRNLQREKNKSYGEGLFNEILALKIALWNLYYYYELAAADEHMRNV